MTTGRRMSMLAIAVLAVGAGVGAWLTRPSELSKGARSRPSGFANRVDQQVLVTAQQLDALAGTRDEGRLSRQALSIADHEVDLAFTSALRDAQNHPPAATPETRAIRDRIAQANSRIAADEATVNRISDLKKPSDADLRELQLAEAEFVLHRNELDDAKRDLARSGADPETWIRRQFQLHQAAMHSAQPESVPAYVNKPSFDVPHTTYGQVRAWFALREKRTRVTAAQQQASANASQLTAHHDGLEKQLASNGTQVGASEPDAKIAAVERRGDDQKTLAEYDQRVQDLQELAQIYGSWTGVVQTQMGACVHGILIGVLELLIVALFVLAGVVLVDRLALRFTVDRRRAATARLLGRFIVEGLGVLAVVFLLLGPPSQLSTLLALAGAGLTVALKDFIVAFFGWFVLMGKNGVRVGDWVEINGIVGEVTDIGLLRTTVLETGNWAGSGHPTGRHVTIVNSFAIEGHYFNFSTSGQWLWDTLEVVVPAGTDPQLVMEKLLDVVRAETETTARKAEEEWKQAARDVTMRGFSADPSVELRPAPAGFTLVVHYMSSAMQRFETRGRLYHAAFDLIQGSRPARSASASGN